LILPEDGGQKKSRRVGGISIVILSEAKDPSAEPQDDVARRMPR
jgi:hypothetical protein